ncbi:hypothetical protein K490DRAFT_64541 [Saccharata proteae CBS 121410]|uniref:Uncharacterized protein n=1 Tax=Saccharata proteae CBS 121410 TaxID=1314787 RepID=A0A9P4HZN8_9PEZI|nr:hypothetical protein K490DRAFT_64541 [Saccharata proteae CBS 121410]
MTAHHLRSSSKAQNDPYSRYLILSSQQEVLRNRLAAYQIPQFNGQTDGYSTPSSPASRRGSSADSLSPVSPVSDLPGYGHRQRSVSPTDSAHTTAPPSPTESEDNKLYGLNKQIKAVLTELLNTTGVKQDDKFRGWVQERLMETEMEMRRQRRRRSSVERELLESIAESLEHNAASSVSASHHYD